ncbi:DNA translocase FtsK 1 isoform X2 [Frankliniella occidentalis]|uniref:DNA translocase FtsK 1 isoform X2 n=1 Tax=Frankliniella occidentalis TaxID=133901 RepID=A0A6J1RVG6_FRAOC|nr:DNA translocase FtsK 1 isoform X2 [Frankliniella occidentalis]
MRVLLVAVLALGAALAKPPPAFGPPAAAPWAAYAAAKPGPVFSRSLVGLGGVGAPDTSAPEDEFPSSGMGTGPLGSMGPMGPMSPFMKIKPFLPTKPTFMPPVVDPSKFIDMKASLLNSLFPGGFPPAGPAGLAGAAPAAYSGLAARALSPFAAPAGPFAPASPVAKPPPPAFLADLFKALSINKTVADPAAPAAAFPGAYPGGAPVPPVVDPGVFISKKAKFLSDLFAGMATTTPAPEPASPDPAAVNAQLAASLQKLLDALATPQDVSEDEPAPVGKARRAADTALLVADAKDKVVDTIIAQLAELKDGMVGAVSDLAAAQKAADAAVAAATPAPSKKPLSPYAAMWAKPTPGATAAPTRPPVAVEPVRQKVVLLGQVFDMLTEIEKNITDAMTVPAQPEAFAEETTTATPDLMDMVKAKINQVIAQTNGSSPPAPLNRTAPVFTSAAKSLRLAGEAPAPAAGPAVDPTFWIPDSAIVGPDAYLAKTKAFLSTILAAKSTPSPIARRSYKPAAYYQGQGQEQQGSPFGPTQQQQQIQPAVQQGKLSSQNPSEAALLYQLRHHHHNRQPYWWN